MALLNVQDGIPAPDASDEAVHAFCRRFLPDFYFVNAPISRMRRHLELMRQLPAQPTIFDFHRPPGAHFTELTLCAHDDAQPGLLSKVAGALLALKINVHTAWIHTLSDPHDPSFSRRIVLDTLILSELSFGRARPLVLKSQERVSNVLREVLEGQSNVAQLLSKSRRRAPAPLHLFDVSASPTNDGYTLLKLRAADDNGVLFRVTSALSQLQLDVAHAQINTFEKSVDDVFFVLNGRGGSLTQQEASYALMRLREMLQNEAGF
jgi:[protein-PII] uridylyltransferase